jgi:NAD(P)H-dependent FMN reductase
MHEILAPVKLVGLPGSLRKASFSRATLIGLRDGLPEKVTLEICDLQLPLYNQDGVLVDEASLTFALSALRQIISLSRLRSPRLIARASI